MFGACRLPVGVPYSKGESPGGWLDLPSGRYSRDPSSDGVDPYNIIAWDSALGRWIPTRPANLSPDGSTYVVVVPAGIRIVDARTGTTRHQIATGFPNLVIGYTDSVVYMISQGMLPEPGIWKLDPAAGTVSKISEAGGTWSIVSGNTAWGTFTDPAAPTVKQLDLTTGVVKDIASSSHKFVWLAGLVGDRALIFESGNADGIGGSAVLGSDGSREPVTVPAGMQGGYFTGFFQDGTTILMIGHGFGLAAYDQAHGLQVLTTSPEIFNVLGGCVPT